jgi:hypothetical protein
MGLRQILKLHLDLAQLIQNGQGLLEAAAKLRQLLLQGFNLAQIVSSHDLYR